MFLILLIQTAPPQDLPALQWAIILALVGVITFLYRQLSRMQEQNRASEREMLEKTLVGLNGSSKAIEDLADAMETLSEQISLKKEIEDLRREFRHETK